MPRTNSSLISTLLPAVAGLALLAAGCERNVRLVGKDLPSVKVAPVTHYGVTLDESASPEEVVYVLLRAIRDDVTAADDEARHAALKVQFDVAAPTAILSVLRNPRLSRDESIYQVVTHWAPIVAYYVDNFDFDLPAARERMRVAPTQIGAAGQSLCGVGLPLADPSGDARAAVLLEVLMAKEKPSGGTAAASDDAGLWRVVQLQFEKRGRPKAELLEGRESGSQGVRE